MGFTTRVHSLNNVVLWYKQFKYRFLDSAHILCAYRLMDPDIAHMQDCMDDRELGSGRRLLQLLIDGSHENVTVYVVRYHKGRNIGSISFPCVPGVTIFPFLQCSADQRTLIQAGYCF